MVSHAVKRSAIFALYEYSTGKVNYRHVYQNFSEIEVELSGKDQALGPGFAAGTTDGPGMFGFQQGDAEVRTLVSS
uniref:Neutral/alkaline non-lysosomal ceramidase N-terminal domain-containing protein n=1 Tax=Salix viminalis TaxID=40686 RepID=A0A6N2K956_SALVM